MGDDIQSTVPSEGPVPLIDHGPLDHETFEPSGLLSLLWLYPVVSLALMAINLYFIVHALRSGRPYYWLWIIFAMPVLGAAAYFFVEMRPTMKRVDWEKLRWRFTSPQGRVDMLSEVVNESPTVKNRMTLAREHEQKNRWSAAADVYRECLTGVFTDDPRIHVNLANALLESGDVSAASEVLAKVSEQRDPKLEYNRKLVKYRCQAETGDAVAAITGLLELTKRSSSLESRYYLAHAMIAAGRTEDAKQEFETIINKFRRGNALMRKSEQVWYTSAKRKLQKK